MDEMTKEETEAQYREYYGDATDAEVAALYSLYGEIVHECPSIVLGLLHEVRLKH
jgi:hypothetical protein